MPLPDDPNAPWPPKKWAPIQAGIEESAVWYSGDERDLEAFYGSTAGNPQRPSDRKTGRGLLGRVKFWERRATDRDTDRQRIHAPAAADIAATSADLLFGDEAHLTIPEAHEQNADTEAKATEERLLELAEVDGWASVLHEGAEVGAGLGLVFLVPRWDPELADHPILTTIHGDHAVPRYVNRQLTEVTFWRVVETDGAGAVWRHLEHHEKGAITHGLYIGNQTSLGRKVSLNDHSDTAALRLDDGNVDIPGALDGQLLVRAVPNALNRKHRAWPVGRADFAGLWGPMDALDETMTSWMQDIRLAKHRIVVPSEFLERGKRGEGASFDLDQSVFSPLNMDPANMDKAGITLTSFEIRAEEHWRTALFLFEWIVRSSGYSSQSVGMQVEGGLKTATQVDSEDTKSMRTTAAKQRYWRRPVEDIAEIMLVLDRDVFGTDVEPMRPRLEFPDTEDDSPRQVAETLQLLAGARAASIKTRVQMAQPELEGDEIDAEVQRIVDEEGLGGVPDPTGFPDEGAAGGQEGGGQ